MAFLFQDQNQGTRNDSDHAQTREAAATVLFRPDYNRRPRNHTESADPSSPNGRRRRSRAWATSPLPPVGIFTPPWEHHRPEWTIYGRIWPNAVMRASSLAWENGMSPCLRDRAGVPRPSPEDLPDLLRNRRRCSRSRSRHMSAVDAPDMASTRKLTIVAFVVRWRGEGRSGGLVIGESDSGLFSN